MRASLFAVLALAVAVCAKCAFSLYVGLFFTPDSVGYQRIGDAIVDRGPEVLREPVDLRVKPRAELDSTLWNDFAPLFAFRMIVYALIIAAMKASLGLGQRGG